MIPHTWNTQIHLLCLLELVPEIKVLICMDKPDISKYFQSDLDNITAHLGVV